MAPHRHVVTRREDRAAPARRARSVPSVVALGLVASLAAFVPIGSVEPAGAAATITTVAGGHGWGDGADQLQSPQGIARDGAGNLYIADAGNLRVQRWAPGASAGVTVAGGHGEGSGPDQLASPSGVAVDPDGNLFIADMANNRVQRWAPGASVGATVAGGDEPGSGPDQLWGPADVALDDVGYLYISDAGNHRVQRWAPGASVGETVAGGNGQGPAADQLYSPMGIELDGAGLLYIADTSNSRVQRWTVGASVGVTVAGGNGDGSEPNQLGAPYDVAVDGYGNVYVVDPAYDRVQWWPPGATTGVTVAGGVRGSAPDELDDPTALLLEPDDTVTVSDSWNARVQRWALGPPTLEPGSGSVLEGDAGATTLEVPVTLSHPTQQTVTASWNTVVAAGDRPGQADPATDYVAASGMITFEPGQTSATVAVSIQGDVDPEANEYLVVSFHDATAATVGGRWGLGYGVIEDDELVTIVPGSITAKEGSSGTTSFEVPVSLSSPSTDEVTASWTTLFVPGAPDGQAQPGVDYPAASGTVAFGPGQTETTVSIEVTGDVTVEPDEYLLVSFTEPTNAKIGGVWGLGAATIVDDDYVAMSIGPASVVEGTGGLTALVIPVHLTNPSLLTVTAVWSTTYVTGVPFPQAEPVVDYVPGSGTVVFAPGETESTITIQVVGDSLPESDEGLFVPLDGITNTTDPTSFVFTIATIVDDD